MLFFRYEEFHHWRIFCLLWIFRFSFNLFLLLFKQIILGKETIYLVPTNLTTWNHLNGWSVVRLSYTSCVKWLLGFRFKFYIMSQTQRKTLDYYLYTSCLLYFSKALNYTGWGFDRQARFLGNLIYLAQTNLNNIIFTSSTFYLRVLVFQFSDEHIFLKTSEYLYVLDSVVITFMKSIRKATSNGATR